MHKRDSLLKKKKTVIISSPSYHSKPEWLPGLQNKTSPTDPSQRHALRYCCYVQQDHVFTQNKENTDNAQDRQEKASYFWYDTKSQLSNFVI